MRTNPRDPLVAAINEQLASGRLETETAACLCGSWQAVQIGNQDWLGIACSFVICTDCGLIRLNPRPTARAYAALYSSDDYRRLHAGDDFIEGSRRRFREGEGAHILECVRQHVPVLAGRTVLEIGAGGGWNLVHFAAAGARVVGYDYSEALVPLGREHGVDVRRGSFADAASDGIRADVVILNHVLEHLTDIAGAVGQTRDLLKPDGVVYVGLPDIEHFHYGQLQLAHTYYFSRRTAAHYLARYGLVTDSIGPALGTHMHGVFRSAERPCDATELSGEYSAMHRVIQTARIRRLAATTLDRLGLKRAIKHLLGRETGPAGR